MFGVPAITHPGEDARNIQVSAYCASNGYEYFKLNECFNKAEIVKDLYPDVNIPILNYPSVWPRFYKLFNDYSEEFFRKFWQLNALLFVLAISLISIRYNYKILPLILFSPISLLTIERGNNDAATFFFVFTPLLVFNSNKIIGFTLAIAASLKIFPIFGYCAFFKLKKPFYSGDIIFGLFFAAPLLLYSISEIPKILSGTSKGFAIAYGLSSILQLSWFSENRIPALVLMLCYMIIIFIIVKTISQHSEVIGSLKQSIEKFDFKTQRILAISACIYFFTFIFFTNWAYRLIFLIPLLVIFSRQNNVFESIIFWNITAIFWIPIVPNGWYVQNILCYILFLPISLILFQIYLSGQSIGILNINILKKYLR